MHRLPLLCKDMLQTVMVFVVKNARQNRLLMHPSLPFCTATTALHTRRFFFFNQSAHNVALAAVLTTALAAYHYATNDDFPY